MTFRKTLRGEARFWMLSLGVVLALSAGAIEEAYFDVDDDNNDVETVTPRSGGFEASVPFTLADCP